METMKIEGIVDSLVFRGGDCGVDQRQDLAATRTVTLTTLTLLWYPPQLKSRWVPGVRRCIVDSITARQNMASAGLTAGEAVGESERVGVVCTT